LLFFAENITANSCPDTLQFFVFPQIDSNKHEDGAEVHFSQDVQNTLTFKIPSRCIGRYGPMPTFPCKPAISPLDWFCVDIYKNPLFGK
ncbi:hypothetical protein Cfor_09784, partial [Coptotermes formosanus]